MMEPEQRTERQITYHVGWKKGKIQPNPAQIKRNRQEPKAQADSTEKLLSNLYDWNMRWLWRNAGTMKDEWLKLLLAAFPILVFGISIWFIYQLSQQQ